MTTIADDGRSPDWPNDSLVLSIWETIMDLPLTGPQIARVRLALDTLYDAELLATAASDMSDRDRIAAVAGARAARKMVSDLIAAMTEPKPEPGPMGRPRKPADQRHHSRRYEHEPANRGRDRRPDPVPLGDDD